MPTQMKKKMEGTGLSDILLEAGLIESGSVTGKRYSGMLSCIHLDQKLLPHTFVLSSLLLVLNTEDIPGLPCYPVVHKSGIR
jgi:hypothetical protein